jgi:hypothetical protein
MWFEKKTNAAIWDSLIDLQSIRERSMKGSFSMIKSLNGDGTLDNNKKSNKNSGGQEQEERFNIG